MKINLYRYLVKEQIVPLIVSLMGLSFILVTGRLLQLARYLFTTSLTLIDLMVVMALAMPKLMLYALPMASMMGVLLAFVRLNSDSELIAFRAAGLSFCQLLPPVSLVLCLTTALSFCNSLFIIPYATQAFEVKMKSLGHASLPVLLKEGTFIDIIPDLVFYFQSVDSSDLSIQGIFVQDERKPDVRLAIVAERAQIIFQRSQNQLIFKIHNGVITRVPDNIKDAQAVSFKAYDLSISLDELIGSSSGTGKSKSGMTLAQLFQRIRQNSQKPDPGLVVELHQRFALPVGALLLGLLGAPLGALFRQRSRMMGITLGLAGYLAYYIILSAGKGLGKNALIPASLAIWTPNLLALIAAIYLWVKMQRETPFGLEHKWRYWTSCLRDKLSVRRVRKERII